MSKIKTDDGTEIFFKDWGTGQPIVFHNRLPQTNHRIASSVRIVSCAFGALVKTASVSGGRTLLFEAELREALRVSKRVAAFRGAAIKDPKYEEHDSLLVWIGGAFDPEGFDLNATNRTLRFGYPK